jgi:hypothetical protein
MSAMKKLTALSAARSRTSAPGLAVSFLVIG